MLKRHPKKLIALVFACLAGLLAIRPAPEPVFATVHFSGIVDATNPLGLPAVKPLPKNALDSFTEFFGSAVAAELAMAGHTVDATTRGVLGDGTTDEGPRMQAIVDDYEDTGALIYMPSDRKYKFSTEVVIKSYYPIFLWSAMGQANMDLDDTPTSGCIVPGDDITGAIFTWDDPDDATNAFQGGGGGIIRLQFNDNPTGFASWRTFDVDACVYVKNGFYFESQECYFGAIKGTAIKVGNCVRFGLNGGRISRCGDTGKSPIMVVGEAGQNGGFGGLYAYQTIIEGTFLSAGVYVAENTGANLRNVYFENNAIEAELQNTFVLSEGTLDIFNKITYSEFRGAGMAINVTTNNAQYIQIIGNTIQDAGGAAEDAINSEAAFTNVSNNTFYSTGKIDLNSTNNIVRNNTMHSAENATSFDAPSRTVFEGNYSDSGTTHLTRFRDSIGVPLTSFRIVDSSHDVGNTAANGGVPASDTTPALRHGATGQEIVWAAADQTLVMATVVLPEGFDGTADVLVDFFVKTDNTGGGGIEAAGIAIDSRWDDTGVQVIDTATDSSPATTMHTITATITADGVTDAARTVHFTLQPSVHANDPVILCGVRIRFVRTFTPL